MSTFHLEEKNRSWRSAVHCVNSSSQYATLLSGASSKVVNWSALAGAGETSCASWVRFFLADLAYKATHQVTGWWDHTMWRKTCTVNSSRVPQIIYCLILASRISMISTSFRSADLPGQGRDSSPRSCGLRRWNLRLKLNHQESESHESEPHKIRIAW